MSAASPAGPAAEAVARGMHTPCPCCISRVRRCMVYDHQLPSSLLTAWPPLAQTCQAFVAVVVSGEATPLQVELTPLRDPWSRCTYLSGELMIVNHTPVVVFTDLVSSQCLHIVARPVAAASSIFSRVVVGRQGTLAPSAGHTVPLSVGTARLSTGCFQLGHLVGHAQLSGADATGWAPAQGRPSPLAPQSDRRPRFTNTA